MFKLILGKCQKDPDTVSKTLTCRIRPKMDRIRNPEFNGTEDRFIISLIFPNVK